MSWAEVLTPVCAPGAAYFGTIMWVYKGALNTFGVVMAAKTWNCADGVGEVRLTLGIYKYISYRWSCLILTVCKNQRRRPILAPLSACGHYNDLGRMLEQIMSTKSTE